LANFSKIVTVGRYNFQVTALCNSAPCTESNVSAFPKSFSLVGSVSPRQWSSTIIAVQVVIFGIRSACNDQKLLDCQRGAVALAFVIAAVPMLGIAALATEGAFGMWPSEAHRMLLTRAHMPPLCGSSTRLIQARSMIAAGNSLRRMVTVLEGYPP
jgi:hypothetical protein